MASPMRPTIIMVTLLGIIAAVEAMDPIPAFCWGVLGGVFGELAGWFKLRQVVKDERPAYRTDMFYWAITIMMVLAGGGLVVAYVKSGMGDIKPLMAVNIGASAPLIMQTLTQGTPRPPAKID